MASRETVRQLNRVVRHSSQPVPESSASIAAVRPATHPQPRVSWGTRATIPNPTNVAVAPPTSIHSSQLRRPGAAPALSPASAARTYVWSTPYRVPSRSAASCQRRCSAPVAEASAMATAPSAISSDPPITCPYVVAAPPRSSPNTSSPHTSPHNWFVLDSGIPRLMPTYLAAYCWNRSPTTHTNPPSRSQNTTSRAAASSAASAATPPRSPTASASIITTSPTEKNVTNASGFMPVR